MSQQIKSIDELVEDLPPEQQRELRDFAEFLLARHREHPRGRPSFQWAGALDTLRGQNDSVELQHQISNWRAEAE